MEEAWNVIQVICAGVVALGGAGGVCVGLYKWFKKPDVTRDEKLKKHDELLDNDNRRLKELEKKMEEYEKSQKLLMRGVYALMRNSIDGNNKDQLIKESEILSDYIFNK